MLLAQKYITEHISIKECSLYKKNILFIRTTHSFNKIFTFLTLLTFTKFVHYFYEFSAKLIIEESKYEALKNKKFNF